MAKFHPLAIFIVIISIYYCLVCVRCVKMIMKVNLKTDEPLFLTPYLKHGEISKARKLSSVRYLPDTPKIASYSGFFTVDEKYNSNIFFWFVPALNGNRSAPVLLWLQGGPGLTGLFGFFVEHGPYFVNPNMTAGLREYAWTNQFHVIYVDNPVGAGFSFTDNDQGYARNEDHMADNMYKFLRQFFLMFPEYKRNEFYIMGESYGGKYVPSLSYKVHREGRKSEINFSGMMIGNGICDPETMMDYGDYLYQLGLIDRKQAKIMRNLSNSIIQNIRTKDYLQAVHEFSQLIASFNVLPGVSYFANITGYNFLYNYLLTEGPVDFGYYDTYLKNPKVRKALHVGNLTFQDGRTAQKKLLLDIMQSVKPKVEVLIDNYRVLFYSGQLDLIVPYPATINFLNNVKWKYFREYQNADRLIWRLKDSDIIAGYVHNVKDFYEVLVRNSGHIVPYDQPRAALDLITRFLNRESFT